MLDRLCAVEGVEVEAAVARVILVTMEIDVGLLGDPGGGAVGGASSPEREEFISQVAPPETTQRVYGQSHVSE